MGIEQVVLRIPEPWSARWFENFVRDALFNMDVRNGIEGTGITIEGSASERVTLTANIGTDIQAWDEGLDDIAALNPTDDNFIVGDGSNWALKTPAQARTSLAAAGLADDNTYTGTNTLGSTRHETTLAGTVAETATITAATITIGATRKAAKVRAHLVGSDPDGIRGGGGEWMGIITRQDAGAQVSELTKDTGILGVFFAATAATVSGNDVLLKITGVDNGGATSLNWDLDIELMSRDLDDFTVA